MLEKQFNFTQTDSKIIERIIEDDNVAINHMVLDDQIFARTLFKLKCIYDCCQRSGISKVKRTGRAYIFFREYN